MREQAEARHKNAIYKGDEQMIMNVSLDHLGNLDQLKADKVIKEQNRKAERAERKEKQVKQEILNKI